MSRRTGTLAQRAIANLDLHIRAYEDEQARGVIGKPGSVWWIGEDGLAKTAGPPAAEIARARPISR
jgi:hypothetical protein